MDRNQIEDEKDYRKLQAIGKDFEKDGHDVKLNAPKEELRVELLEIFDKEYAKDEAEEEAEPAAEEEGEAEEVELGADESEGEEEQPDEEAPAEEEAEAEAPADEEAPAEEEAKEEAEPEPEEKPKQKLFVARRGTYRIWVGADKEPIEFTPDNPQPLPKKLPKPQQAALANAIKMKRIIPVED